MRPIKFRAWLSKEERMYEPMRLYFVPDGKLFVEIPNWLRMWEYPEDIKLMQFTGLKDKNGKEIYEWDIVKFNDGETRTVAWSDELAGFLPFCDYDGEYGVFYSAGNCEVIGNCFQDEELVEKMKEGKI